MPRWEKVRKVPNMLVKRWLHWVTTKYFLRPEEEKILFVSDKFSSFDSIFLYLRKIIFIFFG